MEEQDTTIIWRRRPNFAALVLVAGGVALPCIAVFGELKAKGRTPAALVVPLRVALACLGVVAGAAGVLLLLPGATILSIRPAQRNIRVSWTLLRWTTRVESLSFEDVSCVAVRRDVQGRSRRGKPTAWEYGARLVRRGEDIGFFSDPDESTTRAVAQAVAQALGVPLRTAREAAPDSGAAS